MNTTQEEVLSLLNNSSDSLFITGGAGTGKSYVGRKWLSELNEAQKSVCICAPTGVAALNINGQTLHRQFQIPFSIVHLESQTDQTALRMRDDTVEYLNKIDTLLIDEVSMCRSDVLNFVETVLRKVRKSDEPWGGVRLVAVGDPYQLPPIVLSKEKANFPAPWFFQSDAWRSASPKILNLTHCYRQENDLIFAEMLNRIRVGQFTGPDMQLLIKRKTVKPDSKAMIIATLNRTVDAINDRELRKLDSFNYHFPMKYENYAPDYHIEKNVLAPIDLHLRIGARVMLLNNDQHGRWVNGSLGEVTDISDQATPKEPKAFVKVRLDETDKEVKVEKFTWQGEEATYSNGHLIHRVLGEAVQFPLKLGYAITVHKAQGITLEHVHFMADYVFESGQTYVALSRATSLEGLTVGKTITSKLITANPAVKQFMKG
jgi:ATP-dependent exoDNAse (exonuclease V) alpha subunit